MTARVVGTPFLTPQVNFCAPAANEVVGLKAMIDAARIARDRTAEFLMVVVKGGKYSELVYGLLDV